MQIQQSLISVLNQTQASPQQLLEKIAVGDLVEAVVVKSKADSEAAIIRLVDTLLTIKTSESLTPGQKIVLERVMQQGEAAFRLVKPDVVTVDSKAPLRALTEPSTSLKPGQNIAVEVVKQLTTSTFLMSSNDPKLKQDFEVDISRLHHVVKAGDKMTLEILALQPLQIKLRNEVTNPVSTSDTVIKRLKHFFQQLDTAPTTRAKGHSSLTNEMKSSPAALETGHIMLRKEQSGTDTLATQNRSQYITTKIHQLIQQQIQAPKLSKTLALLNQDRLPVAIKLITQQIVKNAIDSNVLTNQGTIKQALFNSGQFAESKLLARSPAVQQDLKVNIMKALDVITATLDQQKNNTLDTAALVNKLPAHSQSTWLASGRTSAQLLSVLMTSADRSGSLSPITSPLIPLLKTPEQASLVTQMLTQSTSAQVLPRLELLALFREAEQLHSKIQLNQLLNVRENDGVGQQNTWIFDLPIKNKEQLEFLQLLLSRDKKNGQNQDHKEQDIWDVRLRLDTQNLGPLSAAISLHGEDVQVTLTAQYQESSELLTKYLPDLETSLASLGMNVMGTHCKCGNVADALVSTQKMAENDSPFVDVSV